MFRSAVLGRVWGWQKVRRKNYYWSMGYRRARLPPPEPDVCGNLNRPGCAAGFRASGRAWLAMAGDVFNRGEFGCTTETLRRWVRQAKRDSGVRPGMTSDDRERVAERCVAVVGVLVTAGDPEHAEDAASPAASAPRAPDRATGACSAPAPRSGRAGVPARAKGPCRVRRNRPAIEIGGHLLAAYGWKIEGEKSIFGHGGRGAFVVSGEMRLETNFCSIPKGYAMPAIYPPRRAE